MFDVPDEAVESFAPAGLAPYAPADELRHWVLTGLKPWPDGRSTWVSTRCSNRRIHRGESASPTGLIEWSLPPAVACPTLLVRGAETAHTPIDHEADGGGHAAGPGRGHPSCGHRTPLDNPAAFLVAGPFLNEWSDWIAPTWPRPSHVLAHAVTHDECAAMPTAIA